MVTELTQENFTETTENNVCIVDFWAPWCAPCKMMAPLFEELSQEEEFKNLKFCKLNVEDQKDPSEKLGVMSIPTLVMFNMGEEVGRISGYYPKDKLKAEIAGLLSKV